MEAIESALSFEASRSGELTCSFQGKYFHSKYNPRTEGERFAENIQADFSPLCIFVLEPALSYCAPYIKKRFPEALVCAIRFTRAFSDSDREWNHVFYLKEGKISLGEELFSTLGEEKLCASLSFDWPATKQAFPQENTESWNEIKKSILKSRDVIATRAYFSKRWLKNSIIFASRIKKACILAKGSESIVITASGPSLGPSLPFIKENRKRFFLIALSSSYLPLSSYGIKADMVISSDGGYWAKKHLDFPQKQTELFAIEAEGAVPRHILAEDAVIPLAYPDGLETDFLKAVGCPFMISERNGTVAGTALTFAATMTSGSIYLCGLDQAASPAFQHTQPNALETDNARRDFRLKPVETRISASRFNSSSVLEIYRNWFITVSPRFSKNVFRLSDNYHYEYALGDIRDINWDDFSRKESGNNEVPQKIKMSEYSVSGKKEERREKILKSLAELSKTQKFIDEVFPMEAILIKRELSDTKAQNLRMNLAEKTRKLLSECSKLL